MSRSPARTIFAALALSLAVATPAFAGPPWLSVEYPSNPFNPTTKDAYCLVRVYHHGDPAFYPVSGTAEGLVDGRRQSVKLELASTSIAGVYALKYKAPTEGAWVLLVHLGTGGEMGSATAMVTIGKNGEIAGVKVPTIQREGWTMPGPVSPAEVDAALQAQIAAVSGNGNGDSHPGLWVAGLGLSLLPFGLRRRS